MRSAAPGSTRYPGNTGRPADIRASKTVRHRLARALADTTGMSFAMARALIAERRGETPDELEAYLRATFRIDPVGVTAVRNVDHACGRVSANA